MPVKLTGICSKVEVEDEAYIVFPPAITGSINPRALDHLTQAEYIEWGVNMLDPIEPSTIPACCRYLLLPIGYKHDTDSMKLHRGVKVYVHHTNTRLGPTDRDFFIWRVYKDLDTHLDSDYTYYGVWNSSAVFKPLSTLALKKIPDSNHEPMITKPTDTESTPEPAVTEPTSQPIILEPLCKLELPSANLGLIQQEIQIIKELAFERRANAFGFEERIVSRLERVEDSIATLGARMEQFLQILSP